MPRATVDLTPGDPIPLKTAPPDGFVILKKMTYGQLLQRRAMAAKLQVQGGKKIKGFAGEMDMANAMVTIYEFRTCVVDHNLEDEQGNKLNLSDETMIRTLDPQVGEEINQLINKQNQFDLDDDDEGN